MTGKAKQDRVLIFDTTLRDVEQSPVATMTHDEKLEIAELLDEMGVDIIEAGFPIASEGDFAAVTEISRRAKRAAICGLARANFKDIDRCWEAVKHAKRPRIHTFIGTSPLHRAIPNLDRDQMAERIHETVMADGFRYTGEWQAGQIEGTGTATYANGDVYEGEFQAGKRQGLGTMRYATGEVASGLWVDGILAPPGGN